MQHVESGENLVKILIAREVRRSPAGGGAHRGYTRCIPIAGAGAGLATCARSSPGRWSSGVSGHDASMRDENDKRRDDRCLCFVFDRVTSQARRYYV
jgi:hypothetical protein